MQRSVLPLSLLLSIVAVVLPQDALAAPDTMYVTADRLTRRTCPSTSCGSVGWLGHRDKLSILETRDGWARVSKYYDASCKNGRSEYVDSGNASCVAENGIVDGQLAEWVSMSYLSSDRPADPADSAADGERLVKGSDDFAAHRKVFTEAANKLISQGRCTEADFLENGGWVKSTSQGASMYFMYCGGFSVSNRIYLDASSGEVFR